MKKSEAVNAVKKIIINTTFPETIKMAQICADEIFRYLDKINMLPPLNGVVKNDGIIHKREWEKE
jgi:hypothetical protein